MKMKLIIVESPKKAKTINKLLKGKFRVIASFGHILNLPTKKFGVYIKNKKIELQYELINKKFIKLLRKIIDKVDEVLLATDPDREGEFIAWSIANFLKNKKVSRIRFYEITKNAILKAIQNKGSIDEKLVNAQKARRAIDRIIGYTLSPMLWKENLGTSAGRVQSPALKLIVQREQEINSFIPEIYYLLEADFGNFKAYLLKNGDFRFKKDEKFYLEEIIKEIKNKEFEVKEKIITKKILQKPTPIDTALLQRIAFLKYKFSAPYTMKLAQSLYEKGLITYHRTDSFNLSREFLNKIQILLKDYYQEPLKRKIKFIQEAHEAIRPVYLKKNLKLPPNEFKLYCLIFDYTFSACSQNAEVEKQEIILSPLNKDNLKFKALGEKVIFDGFLKFYPFKMRFSSLPNLNKGDKLRVQKLTILEKSTQPPSRYTESSLIKKLKQLGIGRPSTYAEILRILLTRKYAEKEKKYLKPTKRGLDVCQFLENKSKEIMDFHFTARLEKELDKIALGEKSFEEIIFRFWNNFKKIV